MTYSGSRGQPRPPIYDVAQAIESAKSMGSLPQSWLRRVREELASGDFVRIRLGSLGLWVYMGPRGDHVLVTAREGHQRYAEVPVYCSCQGFQMRLASEEGPPGCTHVYALMEFMRSGRRPVELKEPDLALAGQGEEGPSSPQEVLMTIIGEILTGGRSRTLREILKRMGPNAREP